MSSVIVPRFKNHRNTIATLTEESWHEIFDRIPSQQDTRFWKYYRKISRVRLAEQDSFYMLLCDIRGYYRREDYPYRRVYGELLFHIQHEKDSNIPLEDDTQLSVAGMGTEYFGNVSSISLYFTKSTRFSPETYCFKDKNFSELSRYPKVIEVDREDYNFALKKTERMLAWMYCPPPMVEGPRF